MSTEDSPTKKRKCQALQLHDGLNDGLQRQIVFAPNYCQREFKLLEVGLLSPKDCVNYLIPHDYDTLVGIACVAG
jgi:hypothetical protein